MDMNTELLVTSLMDISRKRKLVFINDEPAFALYNTEIKRYSIQQDLPVAPSVYEEIIRDILCKRAVVRAMELLKNKDYTEMELRKKLSMSYYPLQCIESAMDYVKSYQYVDDYRYAVNYLLFKGETLSRKIIECRLKERGVSSDIIERACEEYYKDNENAELDQAIHFIENQCALPEEMDYYSRNKLFAKLYRRGYDTEMIHKAFRIIAERQA